MNSVFKTSCCSNALPCSKMWVTCVDVRCTTEHKYPEMCSFHCTQMREHKRPCVLHLIIIDLKCNSQKSSPPWWNATPSTHSQPVCIKTVHFHINMLLSTRVVTGGSACTWRITKSHSSPAYVNETQAPLWSSKALLSADSYHFTTGLWTSHSQERLQWGWKIYYSTHTDFQCFK